MALLSVHFALEEPSFRGWATNSLFVLLGYSLGGMGSRLVERSRFLAYWTDYTLPKRNKRRGNIVHGQFERIGAGSCGRIMVKGPYKSSAKEREGFHTKTRLKLTRLLCFQNTWVCSAIFTCTCALTTCLTHCTRDLGGHQFFWRHGASVLHKQVERDSKATENKTNA